MSSSDEIRRASEISGKQLCDLKSRVVTECSFLASLFGFAFKESILI
jgi:hypothetical protein